MGECESQLAWEKGKLLWKNKTIFTFLFWVEREELSIGKITSHVVLDENHYWVVFMLEFSPICL